MSGFLLLDSNILIDLASSGTTFRRWSMTTLRNFTGSGMKFFVNQIIVSETIGNFSSENEQQRFLSDFRIAKSNLPFSAAYPAGKAHLAYRNAGGSKLRILPEFLIGAHALVEDLTLMTRDPKVYRAYFPDLNIISPETHPL